MSKAEKIHQQLAAVMDEVQAVGKTQKNESQGFKYRGFDDIANMLHPVFAKHKIFILSEVLDEKTEERKTTHGGNLIYRVLKVKVSYVSGEDGSMLTTVVVGEGMDSGDKAANKAMTAALKYAFSQTFVLPYALEDGDQTTPPESTKAQQQQAPAAASENLQEQLIERMAADGVNNISLIKYCQGKGWLPEKGKVVDLPNELIEAMLDPDNWAKVLASVKPPASPKEEEPKQEPMKGEQITFHAGLYKLMELSGVGRDELKAYLVGKGYITANTVIDNLPQALVDEMTEDENWNKIADAIKKERQS